MPKQTVSVDPFKFHRTRTPGVTFRYIKGGKAKTWFASAGGGKRIRCESEAEAIELLGDVRRAKRRGQAPIVPTKVTFRDLAEEWFAARTPKLRERTRRYTRDALNNVLLPRFGSYLVGAIDADAITKLIRDLEREGLHAIDKTRPVRPLGKSSVENYLKPLQGTLKLAVRRRLIAANPFEHLTDDDRPASVVSKQPHEWTDAQLESLLSASEGHAREAASKYDYTPLLRLSARLGLRLGEVLGLEWRDFNYEAGTLRIERQWTVYREYGPPKTRAGLRTLYLPDDLREELRGLWVDAGSADEPDSPAPDSPIFASKNGTPLGHRNVTQRGFEPARDRAGLPSSLTFHDLRHAAASRLIASGLDDELIADQLGHEDSTITRQVYSHVYDREAKAERIRAALS